MRRFKLLALAAAASALSAPAMADTFTQSVTGAFALPAGPGTSGPASTFPINFTFSGLTTVQDVNVEISGLSHTYADDIWMALVSPTDTAIALLYDAGGNANYLNSTLTLDQQATIGMLPKFIPNTSILLGGTNGVINGTWRPSVWGLGGLLFGLSLDGFSLNQFNGEDANGIWKLYIGDKSNGDVGSFTGAKLIIVSDAAAAPAVPEPATWAMMIGGLALAGLQMRRRKTSVSFA